MSTEYIIERLGHRGEGIASGPLFAPNTLPGETVTGTRNKNRLSDVKIVIPSPDRVRPPCPHFKSCGGCVLQHASDAFLKSWKAEIVKNALAAQGLGARIDVVSVSPANSRRRATLSGTRTKKGALVGFHTRASNTTIDIPDCKILHPSLLAAMPALRELTQISASRKSEVSLALTMSLAGLDLHITSEKQLDAPMQAALGAIALRHRFARICWNDTMIAQNDTPAHSMAGTIVTPPPGAFLQATLEGQAALIQAVSKSIKSAKKIVDLFAGCGTFSLPLAEHAAVHAVESSAAMLNALDAGWRHSTGLHRVTTQNRDLFRRPLLVDELNTFDAVVIDPPRAGAEAQFREIAKSNIKIVAAVSCNPVTFARDAKHLTQAGFKIDQIEIVDQFRWSSHIELVAACVR